MAKQLEGKRVAVLVDNGFEQIELTSPIEALRDAGAEAVIVSPQKDKVRAWDMKDWGETFDVDLPLDRANADDFDALVLPGGVMNPDRLRTNARAVALARAFSSRRMSFGAVGSRPILRSARTCATRGRSGSTSPS